MFQRNAGPVACQYARPDSCSYVYSLSDCHAATDSDSPANCHATANRDVRSDTYAQTGGDAGTIR